MKSRLRSCLAAAALALTGCAAARQSGPLDVRLGQSPAETGRALRSYDFCASEAGAGRQIYPQCGRPGAAYGDAWVVVHYRGDRAVRIQRFERWADVDRATRRWSELVERRAALGPATDSARDRVFARQGLPERLKAWRAFERGDALVAVYLLDVTDASEPAILEELLPLDGP